MQDVATIFALNVFRLPVSLQVAIEFVLSFKFFGTLIAKKNFFSSEWDCGWRAKSFLGINLPQILQSELSILKEQNELINV